MEKLDGQFREVFILPIFFLRYSSFSLCDQKKSVFMVSMNFSHIPGVVVKIWLSIFP